MRTLLGVLLGLLAGGGIGGAYVAYGMWTELPAVDHLAEYDPALPMRIYARDGTILAEYGPERRELVSIDKIPPVLRQAVLAIEDSDFYRHSGVHFGALARSALENFRSGEHAQGGSTITMQVARVFFLTREKTYFRKLTEIMLAYKLESMYTKDKLLELYMNQIYLGERSYGFAAAANVYFDKRLEELTLAESALLAGLPKAPSSYNPVVNFDRAVIRQRHILNRMFQLGHIDTTQLQEALAEELKVRPRHRGLMAEAAYAVEQVRKMMVDHFGDDAYSLGIDIVTTIDSTLQQEATRKLREGLLRTESGRGYSGPEGYVKLPTQVDLRGSLARLLAPWRDIGSLRVAVVIASSEKNGITAALRDGERVHIPANRLAASALSALKVDTPANRRIAPGAVIRVLADVKRRWTLEQLPSMEGALVSIDVESGEILALTGGFDFTANKFDHVVQAVRQTGSTFKPFVFSAALERGLFPGTLIDDTQRTVTPSSKGRKAWSPRNFGDNYEGFISARRGLVRSKNVLAVNLMEAAGIDHVSQFAARFGFSPELNPSRLPLALGAGSATPLQLAQAYAVFANGGHWIAPVLVKQVSERNGGVLYESQTPTARITVISARNAYVMDSMLRDVVRYGTGRRAATLNRSDVAGKTGTSNDARDAWFAGYSSGLAAVVWIGYDQPRSLGKRSTGGMLALPVWADFMKFALAGRTPIERRLPDGLTMVGGDYVYSEFLAGDCVEASSPYVRPVFSCETRHAFP